MLIKPLPKYKTKYDAEINTLVIKVHFYTFILDRLCQSPWNMLTCILILSKS